MPAPLKTGLDYYPMSVDLLEDHKFVKAKSKYGYLAVMIYIALLELIYSDKGYYVEYDLDQIAWSIQAKLQGKYCPQGNVIQEVVECLVACGLFSRDHLAQNILTSKRIQQTYYRAVVERKNVSVEPSYWMLSIDEMKALSEGCSILQSFINRPINSVNQPTNDNKEKNRERIVKEIRDKYPGITGIESLTISQLLDIQVLDTYIAESDFLQVASASWLVEHRDKIRSHYYANFNTRKNELALVHNYTKSELANMFGDAENFDNIVI